MNMVIKDRLAELHPEITCWRRDFHQFPETSYDVFRTATRVAELLHGFGCDEVVEGIGKTGVVATIRGRSTASGRAIGLRADMDALPITESTGLAYASRTLGKMHACGHDGHTAMLLGAAQYLAETRNFDGTAVAVFQPAEEDGAGGKAMVDDGLMDRFGIQEIYGMHNLPGLPVGLFATRPGPIMGSSDEFMITVTGRGGHPASPQKAIDTTMVAAQILLSLNTIVSRDVNPHKRVALGVTTFNTDSNASNIIAQQVVMEGTIRTLDEEYREIVRNRVNEITKGTAAAFGAGAEVEWFEGYPVAINWPEQTDAAIEVARRVSGALEKDEVAPLLQCEDFAYMLQARPGAFIFIGNGKTPMLHDPVYDFNDEAIPLGARWYAEIVETRLPIS